LQFDSPIVETNLEYIASTYLNLISSPVAIALPQASLSTMRNF